VGFESVKETTAITLHLDGRSFSGSGTIVRFGVPLAALAGQGLHLTHIRARRDPPGLQPQHRTAVEVVTQVYQGSPEGGIVGSQGLIFRPSTSGWALDNRTDNFIIDRTDCDGIESPHNSLPKSAAPSALTFRSSGTSRPSQVGPPGPGGSARLLADRGLWRRNLSHECGWPYAPMPFTSPRQTHSA